MATSPTDGLAGRVVASKYKVTRAVPIRLGGHDARACAWRCEARALDDVSAVSSGDVWLWLAPWDNPTQHQAVTELIEGWQHVNTARLIDWGDDPRLGRFWAYEAHPGAWLSELIAQSAPLPWRRALDITAQTLRALWHAHDHGLSAAALNPDLVHIVPATLGAPSSRDAVRVLALGWSEARDRRRDLDDVATLLEAMLDGAPRALTAPTLQLPPPDLDAVMARLRAGPDQPPISARDALDLLDALSEGRPLHTLTAHDVLSTARNVELPNVELPTSAVSAAAPALAQPPAPLARRAPAPPTRRALARVALIAAALIVAAAAARWLM